MRPLLRPQRQTPEIWLKQDDAKSTPPRPKPRALSPSTITATMATMAIPPAPTITTSGGCISGATPSTPREGTEWTAPKPFDGIDDYGAYWNIPIVDATQPVNFIIHRGDNKDPGPDQSMIPVEDASIWIQSGVETIYPSQGAAENTVYIHYHRADGDYGDHASNDYDDFWGLHTWDGAPTIPGWTTPRKPAAMDIFGAVFEVPLLRRTPPSWPTSSTAATKRTPARISSWCWTNMATRSGSSKARGPIPPSPTMCCRSSAQHAAPGDLDKQQAYWVSEDTHRLGRRPGLQAADYSALTMPPPAAWRSATTTSPAAVPLSSCQRPRSRPSVDGFRHLAGMPTLQDRGRRPGAGARNPQGPDRRAGGQGRSARERYRSANPGRARRPVYL